MSIAALKFFHFFPSPRYYLICLYVAVPVLSKLGLVLLFYFIIQRLKEYW